jgi:LacI family transcriptional regulator
MTAQKKTTEERNTVRIKDIAEKAKVSAGTVDRVLHNRGRVADEVKERVLRIARELNYEPNFHARALVSKRIYRLAALIPDPAVDSYWEAPQAGIAKAESELKQYGVRVTQLIFDPCDAASFRRMAEQINGSDFDGVLVAPIFYRESLSFFRQWKSVELPFVLFNTHIPDYLPLSYIGQDSYQSGYLAGKLLHYGHQQEATFFVLHIDEDVPNSSHLIKKEQGFFDYFAQNTPSGFYRVQQAVLHESSDKSKFHKQLLQLLSDNPETQGFFVTNSRANTVAAFLEDHPEFRINLVGYDLMEKNLRYLNSGLINFLINQNPKGQGYYGIYALADHLVFRKPVQPIRYLPLDIITKENLHYYIEAGI